MVEGFDRIFLVSDGRITGENRYEVRGADCRGGTDDHDSHRQKNSPLTNSYLEVGKMTQGDHGIFSDYVLHFLGLLIAITRILCLQNADYYVWFCRGEYDGVF